MKKISSVFISLFLTLTVSAYATDQTESYNDVIQNTSSDFAPAKMIGKAISPKTSPYVIVAYEDGDDNRYREDGILISKKHVLIGAHGMCKYLGKIKRIYVQAGDNVINVADYSIPDSFKCEDSCRADDYLILTLEENVKTNKPLPVANAAKSIKKGVAVQIAGFGRANSNDYFGKLKQANTKIESKKKTGFFMLKQYLGTYCYTDAEGSPAVTVKVKNKKGKMVKAVAGLVTCTPKNKRGYRQDQLMTLQNKNAKAFIKKILGKEAKFM